MAGEPSGECLNRDCKVSPTSELCGKSMTRKFLFGAGIASFAHEIGAWRLRCVLWPWLITAMNSAPLACGVVRLVRGVHHDPTAARTPIGHVSRNAQLFLDFLFQTVFRPQNPLAWEVLGKN